MKNKNQIMSCLERNNLEELKKYAVIGKDVVNAEDFWPILIISARNNYQDIFYFYYEQFKQMQPNKKQTTSNFLKDRVVRLYYYAVFLLNVNLYIKNQQPYPNFNPKNIALYEYFFIMESAKYNYKEILQYVLDKMHYKEGYLQIAHKYAHRNMSSWLEKLSNSSSLSTKLSNELYAEKNNRIKRPKI